LFTFLLRKEPLLAYSLGEMARPTYVIGNWKMFKTAREATEFVSTLQPMIEGSDVKVCLAVPFTSIASLAAFTKDTSILVGAQNMHDAREGAFTGEIAAIMLKEAGASFVLIGHSERRRVFGEDLSMIHRKVERALLDDLTPVLCVGESLEERNKGLTESVLYEQIVSALEGVPKTKAKSIVIAYEPVWAIGTGKHATADIAEEAHAMCRDALGEVFGKRIAASMPILYGGSVKPDNVQSLIAEEEIDGVLVGGASLDATTFGQIVQHCRKSPPKSSRKPLRKPK
jgi:triosephosphate isomerase